MRPLLDSPLARDWPLQSVRKINLDAHPVSDTLLPMDKLATPTNADLNPQDATAHLAHVSHEELPDEDHMYPDDGDYDPSSDY